jgi:hypothetical protein
MYIKNKLLLYVIRDRTNHVYYNNCQCQQRLNRNVVTTREK